MVTTINDNEIVICNECGVVYRYNRDLKCPLCVLVKELEKKLNINPKFYFVPSV